MIMPVLRRSISAFLFLAMGCLFAQAQPLDRFRYGVVTSDDDLARMQAGGVRQYLEVVTDYPVDLFLYETMGDLASAMIAGEIDFARLSPSAYLTVKKGCACVLPLVTARPDERSDRFYSVMFAKRDVDAGPAATTGDLPTGPLGIGPSWSVASRILPLKLLASQGIDPKTYFDALVEVANPVEGLQGVLDGRLSASLGWSTLAGGERDGFSAGTLKDFILSGRPGGERLSVVWKSPPIPYTVHAVSQRTPLQVRENLLSALLEMPVIAPDLYAVIEPELQGGLSPLSEDDLRPLE